MTMLARCGMDTPKALLILDRQTATQGRPEWMPGLLNESYLALRRVSRPVASKHSNIADVPNAPAGCAHILTSTSHRAGPLERRGGRLQTLRPMASPIEHSYRVRHATRPVAALIGASRERKAASVEHSDSNERRLSSFILEADNGGRRWDS